MKDDDDSIEKKLHQVLTELQNRKNKSAPNKNALNEESTPKNPPYLVEEQDIQELRNKILHERHNTEILFIALEVALLPFIAKLMKFFFKKIWYCILKTEWIIETWHFFLNYKLLIGILKLFNVSSWDKDTCLLLQNMFVETSVMLFQVFLIFVLLPRRLKSVSGKTFDDTWKAIKNKSCSPETV
ncbi:hypothetical protein [Bartonella sp. cb54]|uniref:hypothetical protein n=1 Tax=Bartonella sp. cb54 TaxID=3385560 RepID=UPI0039A54CF8